MRAAAAVATLATLALVGCGGGTKKPEPVANVVTGEPSGSSAQAEPAGDARVIQRTQSGGTIELAGNRTEAMAAADKEMAGHCGPGQFTITQEGEEVVGDADANPAQVAWRVYYSCTGALPPPLSP
jgi:hypothetical protein